MQPYLATSRTSDSSVKRASRASRRRQSDIKAISAHHANVGLSAAVLLERRLQRSLDKGDTEQAGCDVAGEHDAERCRVAHGDQGNGMIQANSIRQIRDPSEGCSLVLVGSVAVDCESLRSVVVTSRRGPEAVSFGAGCSLCGCQGAGLTERGRSPLSSLTVLHIHWCLAIVRGEIGSACRLAQAGKTWVFRSFSHRFRFSAGCLAAQLPGGRVANRRSR